MAAKADKMTHLDFLYLLFKSTDICITLCRRFVKLHNADHGIRIVLQHAYYTLRFVMQQHSTIRLQQVLIHKAHDRDIKLWATSRADNSMVVVNDLLKCTHSHRGPPQIIYLRPIFLILLLPSRLRLKPFLILHELFFKEEVVFYALHFEEPKAAAGGGKYGGELRCSIWTALLLLAYASWEGWFPLLLLLFVITGFLSVVLVFWVLPFGGRYPRWSVSLRLYELERVTIWMLEGAYHCRQ